MGQDVSFMGTTRTVPDRKERPWGADMTGYLVDVAKLDQGNILDTGGKVISKVSSATLATLTAAATLTPTATRMRVESAAGAIILSATTAIADGDADGQELILLGTSDTNTVQVPDAANTKINGDMVLFQGDQLYLIWDLTLSLWIEVSRNN